MASIAPLGKYQAFDDNGNPLAGGKLYTYLAGTATPKATYTTAAGDIANTNPVILDASGYADVWLGDGGYKFTLTKSDDTPIFTVDDIGGSSSTAFGAEVNEISSNTTITTVYRNSANICTGSPTLSLLSTIDAGEGFYLSVKNEGTGTVTIDPDAGELIDGLATIAIEPDESALIICNGMQWYTFFLYQGFAKLSGNNAFTGNMLFPDGGELTISSGAITVIGVNHTVDTEADAASDNLDTINGGSDGQILILSTENNARDVVITSAGNIASGGGANITLGNVNDNVVLKYDGTLSKWLILSATASQGAKADSALQYTTPGLIVDRAYAEFATYTSTTSAIPYDDSIPQIGEGLQILSAALTPKTATNRFRIRYSCGASVSGKEFTLAAFVNGSSNAVNAVSEYAAGGTNLGSHLSGEFEYVPGSTSAQTITIRIGAQDTTTLYINGTASGRVMGGVSKAVLIIEEISV